MCEFRVRKTTTVSHASSIHGSNNVILDSAIPGVDICSERRQFAICSSAICVLEVHTALQYLYSSPCL